jgi:hypothetical protein
MPETTVVPRERGVSQTRTRYVIVCHGHGTANLHQSDRDSRSPGADRPHRLHQYQRRGGHHPCVRADVPLRPPRLALPRQLRRDVGGRWCDRINALVRGTRGHLPRECRRIGRWAFQWVTRARWSGSPDTDPPTEGRCLSPTARTARESRHYRTGGTGLDRTPLDHPTLRPLWPACRSKRAHNRTVVPSFVRRSCRPHDGHPAPVAWRPRRATLAQ